MPLGLHWDVGAGSLGLELSVQGYSQRAPALLTDLTAALAALDPARGAREAAAFPAVSARKAPWCQFVRGGGGRVFSYGM
jgi:hypothetical protein